MRLIRLLAFLLMMGGCPMALHAQICINSFVDKEDRFQLSTLKLGADGSGIFKLPMQSTDCVQSRIQDDEYGCTYRTQDGTQFQIYSGKITQVIVPARLLTATHSIAKAVPNEELREVIRKVNKNLPKGFPVWRAYYVDRTDSVDLSTGQCILSSTAYSWELILRFNSKGRLKDIEAYSPYP